MRKRVILFIVVLFTTAQFPVLAQLNPDNISVYADIEGTSVNDVLTDRMGNVWMATQNGLVRFDGYEYERYYPDPNDSTTLGSILTYRLFEDRKGNIWISCMDLISEYDPNTKSFKNYNYSHLTNFPLYSQKVIPTITQDLNGRIYFGIASYLGLVANQTLLYKEENEQELKRFDTPGIIEAQSIFRSTVDTKGNVWLVAINGFFKIEPDGNFTKIPWPVGEFPSDKAFNLVIESDNNGLLWISAPEATLSAWDPVTGAVRSYSMKPLFGNDSRDFLTNEMEIDSNGNIWLATNKGLVCFDRGEASFKMLEDGPDQKFSRMEILSLNFDAFENLWLGTMQSGLLKYRVRAALESFKYNKDEINSITPGWATKLMETGDGNIWVATSGGVGPGGLNLLNPATQSIAPLPFPEILPGYESYNVIGILSPGNILIQANTEFFLFNTITRTVIKTTLDPTLDSSYFHNIFREKNGNIWFCTANGAFLKPKNSEKLQRFAFSSMPSSNITSNEVVNMHENENGVWLLTNNGLYHYDSKTNIIERHGYNREKGDVFWSQDFNSFYEDSDGIAWVGTWGGGLSRYNIQTGKIKTYSTSDGLPSMSIQGILADEKNNALWISTFEGISRFNILEEQFNNFSVEDGIQGRLFADGAYHKTSGGLFIFGGNNGITILNPDDIAKNSLPPKVFITDFKTGETSLDKVLNSLIDHSANRLGGIDLSFGQNNISITYTGMHYDNPSQNQFAYKLDNYDENWRMVGNLRTAYYYNLPPGKYVFHVKAANSSGVWSDEVVSLNIQIRPPWWRTWWAYLIYGFLLMALIRLIHQFQKARTIRKERERGQQKELAQAKEIEKAYVELKNTQSQLIQSEKMASLGELTAGIAHEIQNPLNFVNNFSEVSRELISEMNDELAVGTEASVQLAREIAGDIDQNLEKINHHGKRADAIVKGMLQHSRTSNGIKEPTDINALADEYLRLAYHGLRAKDKDFNVTLKTDFDETIGMINIIPQDIGRVLLNLINNAFFTLQEKQKSNNAGYKPVVSVSSKKSGNYVEITVRDNGNGIPRQNLDKILQPFFTTKPAGQGTGLGLSICYDIVTKGHGGELKMESREGEGTTFIVYLPD